jgi:myo-inositol-1(or 4)-monophosphatase
MLQPIVALARRAGALLLDGLKRGPTVELKSPYEVVTEMDRASEQLIVKNLIELHPTHAIIAEEGTAVEHDSEYLWLIDPLDGTNNYAHGFPMFCVSIGLVRNRRLELGVVYDPIRDEIFAGQAGVGAWRNGHRLRVSKTPTLAAALVSTGFPYDYGKMVDNNRDQFDRIQRRSQGVRRAGSAALDLCYVACGRLDAHWELRLKPWDSAAGALIIREAGGTLTDWRGGELNPWSHDLIASNGLIHTELLDCM